MKWILVVSLICLSCNNNSNKIFDVKLINDTIQIEIISGTFNGNKIYINPKNMSLIKNKYLLDKTVVYDSLSQGNVFYRKIILPSGRIIFESYDINYILFKKTQYLKSKKNNYILHGDDSIFFTGSRKPKWVIGYLNGKKNGEYKIFKENGNIFQRVFFKDDEAVGLIDYESGEKSGDTTLNER